MKRELPFQASSPDPQQPSSDEHVTTQPPEQFGAWLSGVEAQRYLGLRSIKGWYAWRKRYAIVPRADGRVAKGDLDRVRRVQRTTKRRMHPNSLANLNLGVVTEGRKRA